MTEYERHPEENLQLRLDVMELAKNKIIEFESSRDFIIYVNDLFKFVKSGWIVAEGE